MRLREGRLVNAGLVRADATKRIEIRKDPSTVEMRAIVRHEARSPDVLIAELPRLSEGHDDVQLDQKDQIVI